MDEDVSNPLKLSVVMPVFNGSEYLSSAIESILHQSYSNFEFIIINDGSTDQTESIILSYIDQRIKYYCNSTNLGIVNSLNIGFSYSTGEYIARMDADDIASEDRFDLQISMLDANPNIGLCGSWYRNFGSQVNNVEMPISDESIRLQLLFHTAFAHSSVMLRSGIIKKRELSYRQSYIYAEDYHLWIKLIEHTQAANMPLFLLNYRIHETNVSFLKRKLQIENAGKARSEYIKYFFKNRKLNVTEMDLLYNVFNGNAIKTSLKDFLFIIGIFEEIFRKILKTKDYNSQLLDNMYYVVNKFYATNYLKALSPFSSVKMVLFSKKIFIMIIIKSSISEKAWNYIKPKSNLCL